jgi:hypothetical protein
MFTSYVNNVYIYIYIYIFTSHMNNVNDTVKYIFIQHIYVHTYIHTYIHTI